MLPFLLYSSCAIVTGFHMYTLLSFSLQGAPFNPLEVISLLGSVGLLIAAYISLYRPAAGARVALIAALVIWVFYAPAIATSVRKRFTAAPAVVSGLIPRSEVNQRLLRQPR